MKSMERLAAANPIPRDSVEQLAALLPELPSLAPRQAQPRRRNKPVLVALAVVVVATAVAAPAFALRHQLTQTVKQFFASNAPKPAKERIGAIVRASVPGGGKLSRLQEVLVANGPDGHLQLYRLWFSNGDTGSTIVNTDNDPAHVVVGATEGRPRPLAKHQTIDIRLSSVAFPGRSPIYFDGVVAPRVVSVVVASTHGRAETIVVGGGYLLGWVKPQSNGRYGDGEVLAKDAQGRTVGRFDYCQINQTGSDVEFRPHRAGMPTDPHAACTIPPKRDGP
jgi:hypothetical protein